MNFNKLLLEAIHASIEGGNAIMNIYESDFTVEQKEDKSPLTLADKDCHNIIEKRLSKTKLPLLSEEGKKFSYSERRLWEYFWLVDPLDGTKEFVKRNGEFTVNIALIHQKAPVLGVIYVPVRDELYFGMQDLGSYKTSNVQEYILTNNINSLLNYSQKLPIKIKRDNYVVVGSRSHMSAETARFLVKMKKKYNQIDILSVGSSLKLCMVAEGKADVYPRYAPTMEWDTAAGHAIAKFAGFSVHQYESSKEVIYNKENLLNPWFLAR